MIYINIIPGQMIFFFGMISVYSSVVSNAIMHITYTIPTITMHNTRNRIDLETINKIYLRKKIFININNNKFIRFVIEFGT